jgi:hypothetical protein
MSDAVGDWEATRIVMPGAPSLAADEAPVGGRGTAVRH